MDTVNIYLIKFINVQTIVNIDNQDNLYFLMQN
jgi:hypothetical protein